MSVHHSDPSEITFHPDHSGGTGRIWKVFWILSGLTIIELALGYLLYAKHGEWAYTPVISTKIVIGVLTLAKAYYIVSVFMHLGDEIRNFIKQTNLKITSIELNPKLYRRSEKYPRIRRVSINKNITLFYRYFPTKKEVTLLTFWNTNQDPKKLKY